MIGGELTGIAIVASAALVCGALFSRLRQPPLVGYIIAGILLGPTALGVVHDREQIELLAELGVLMLLFIIGLELSLRAFKLVWRQSLGTAGFQIVAALIIAFLVKLALGWTFGEAVLVGFVLALSSTAVAIKILEDIGELRSEVGRIAVGVLIAQDLAVVPMMLVVGMLGEAEVSIAGSVVAIAAAVGVLSLVIVVLGQKRRYRLPFIETIEGNIDLTAMAALGLCFAAAAVSGLLGLSPAYGAFLAGLVVGNTADRAKMIRATQPIQAVLIMIFFVSIGLLIDIAFIWDNLGLVLLLVFVVTLVKTVMNIAIIRFFGAEWRVAFLSGTVMGQVGEFSFVLVAAGLTVGLIGDAENRLLVSLIALSLAFSPLWLITARRLTSVPWRTHMNPRVVLGRIYRPELRTMDRLLRPGVTAVRRAASAVGSVAPGRWRRRQARDDDAPAAPSAVPADEAPAKGDKQVTGTLTNPFRRRQGSAKTASSQAPADPSPAPRGGKPRTEPSE